MSGTWNKEQKNCTYVYHRRQCQMTKYTGIQNLQIYYQHQQYQKQIIKHT